MRILEPHFRRVSEVIESFPVKASIVIPVRDRESTLRVALSSALDQQADFPYNVIVVDNHSTDGTATIIEETRDQRLVHLIPGRRDLGIGGCWNEAIYSDRCGRYALQLDSDDLFSEPSVLAQMVECMETEGYAMLVGSYRTVDFELDVIPPGLVDHREWTPENGHNNALRVNGFGAPRAYDVTVVRRFGFPNVSYGEDYAVGLRTCREYEIGRIFEPLYLCRRWEGNSDSAPPVEVLNRLQHVQGQGPDIGDSRSGRAEPVSRLRICRTRLTAMNWDKRIIGRAEPAGAVEKVEQLFARQLPSWPLLRTGVENLERARVKRLCIRWFEVLVRHIPHRLASTTVRLDPPSDSRASLLSVSRQPS